MIDVKLKTKKIYNSLDSTGYEVKGRCIIMGELGEVTCEIRSLLEGLEDHPIGRIALSRAIEELIKEAEKK